MVALGRREHGKRRGADGDGDGRADIFTNQADTFASIANYFRDAGWRPGQPWGVPATVPAGFDWSAVKTRLDAPTCPRVHDRHSQWKTARSEEHTSELQSLMRNSYAVCCLENKNNRRHTRT